MFKVDVGVAVNMNEAEIKRHWRKIKPAAFTALCKELAGWDEDKTEEGHALGRMCIVLSSFVVLLNLDRRQFRESVGTLTHEMTHVAQYLLRHRRIPLSEDTEEVHSYLTEYLVTEALRRMY